MFDFEDWLLSLKTKIARRLFKSALKDEGMRIAYESNIAMIIYDNRKSDGRYNIAGCNVTAGLILKRLFEEN